VATSGVSTCEWVSLRAALAHFVTFRGSTQSQRHIKPLHWYVACRLVVEGGFDPDEIVPRPPFRVERKGARSTLFHDPSRGGAGERTVYGGLKTKNVDVVVTKDGISPVLAVFGALYRQYDERFVYAAPDLKRLTVRREWDRASTAFGASMMPDLDYESVFLTGAMSCPAARLMLTVYAKNVVESISPSVLRKIREEIDG
jgi:hypothetical protein